MTRLSIDISNELHHYLKIHTARKKITVMSFVRDAIYQKIDQEKVPNRETIKAIEESRNGIGITKNSSVEEMMNEIYQELKDEGYEIKKHA